MNIKSVIDFLKQNLIFILIVVVLFATIAYLSTSFKKPGYTHTRTVFLKVELNNASSQIPDIQSTTDSAVALISSRDFQNSTGSSVPTQAKKLSPQVVSLTATADSADSANQSVEKTISTFNTKSSQFFSFANVTISPLGPQDTPSKQLLNNKILAIAGGVIGFVVALSTIAVSKYFRL